MALPGFFRHSAAMNQVLSAPLALLDLSPVNQLLVLFFLGWMFIMFVVHRIDGTRAR